MYDMNERERSAHYTEYDDPLYTKKSDTNTRRDRRDSKSESIYCGYFSIRFFSFFILK